MAMVVGVGYWLLKHSCGNGSRGRVVVARAFLWQW